MASRKCSTRQKRPVGPTLGLNGLGSAEQTLLAGDHEEAKERFDRLRVEVTESRLQALVDNDLAAINAGEGRWEEARAGFARALEIDPESEPARLNLAILGADLPTAGLSGLSSASNHGSVAPIKVAIMSFLFNWPSTGGGIVHTVELGRFLDKAGYEVEHFYARFDPWGIGKVTEPVGITSHELLFGERTWNVPDIQGAFRNAVDQFDPDYVLVTDSWNFKPLLAEAVSAYPYILRFQAMECFCPLNNVRLLPGPNGTVRQCNAHQFASPDVCHACLRERGPLSGSLHQAERRLSAVGSKEYDETLRRVVAGTEAVLVVNPLQEAMIAPYAQKTMVVPSGMDAARFLWPTLEAPKSGNGRTRILFAGLAEEFMKGFHILMEAGARLWSQRRDFEIVITGDAIEQEIPFARFVGWQSQADLPRWFHETDLCVVPTIAQEALGRTAVEAMAAGRPVVASRIGGLSFTVAQGSTGLLCEPGNPVDLAAKLGALLDDPAMRRAMGLAGRKRFEEHYSWDVIIERSYRPLLSRRKAERSTVRS